MIYFLIEILIVAAIISVDLGTKAAAVNFLQDKPFKQSNFIEGFIDLKYSENTGATWGIFKDKTLALIIFTAIALSILLVVLIVRAKKDKRMFRIPLLMIFAGGVGNLVDRIMLGYVRDFLHFTFIDFPIFNLADSAISFGAAFLVLFLIIEMINESKGKGNMMPISDNDSSDKQIDNSTNNQNESSDESLSDCSNVNQSDKASGKKL
ncbi:MAG: signal peptidase II [Clostridia bacterium]|nr:signal peptidase II [Clostridia bacterium]